MSIRQDDLSGRDASRFQVLFEHLADALFLADLDGVILDVNPYTTQALGWSRDELVGRALAEITPPTSLAWWERASEISSDGNALTFDARFVRKDGSEYAAEVRVTLILEESGPMLLAVARDLSDRLRLEAQLRQATKMEAVGRLAGGVAHDFNNLLTVILTYVRFLGEDLDSNSPMVADVQQIREAAQRASALTHRLLAFSRRQVLEPELLDWTRVVLDMVPLLRRLIGEDVELVTDLDTDPSRFIGDPGQLSQVVMNLAVNARDAMPQGGQITLTTLDQEIDASLSSTLPGMRPGTYTTLELRDTGAGMTEETQSRLFEPFFTTKTDGTGLGLAMVYGIVKQSNGYIYAHSTLEKGSVFRIYMPVASARAAPAPRPRPSTYGHPASGDETILLVEDDDLVRNVATRALARSGYRVFSARNAGEALLLFERHGGEIDLLLTDVVMPHMSGGELAERLTSTHPHLPVLFMTGYTDDAIVRHGLSNSRAALLRKPFEPESLVGKIREILDSDRDSAALPPRPARVLVIDDDRLLRSAIRRLLRGAEVSEAASAREARALMIDGDWDVVLCDVHLGDSTGIDLHSWMLSQRSDLASRTVFLTGSVEPIMAKEVSRRQQPLLTKPVEPDELKRVATRIAGTPVGTPVR